MRVLFFMLSLLSCLDSFCQNHTPSREVEATDDGIIVTYRFNGGIIQDDPLRSDAQFWKIPGFTQNEIAGEPSVPFKCDMFTIPDNVEVNVELIDSAYADMPFTMSPSYPPLLQSDSIGYTLDRVPPITFYQGWFPYSAVIKGDTLSYRGQRLIRVGTYPVQYNLNHTARAFSMIKYKVSFSQNGSRVRGRNYVSETADRNISISDHFLENVTLNYSLSNNGRQNIARRNTDGNRSGNNAQLDNRSYLIVTTDNFLDAVNDFAEWKRTKGFNVLVESKQQGEWSFDEIRYLIEYRNGQNTPNAPLYYVLLVGDTEYIPCDTLSYQYQHVSDFRYSFDVLCDYAIDFHVGRIPVKTNLEAQVVFNKIISYEMNPPDDTSFYRNITTVAYFENKGILGGVYYPSDGMEMMNMCSQAESFNKYISLIDSNYVVNRVYFADSEANPLRWYMGDSIPIELRKPNFLWDGHRNDVNNLINEGTFLLEYIGHGEYEWWCNIMYGKSDVNSLNNNNKTPVILSWTCQSGNFDYNTNSLAEEFLLKESKGCVGIIANSENIYEPYVTILANHTINAIWPGFLSYLDNDTTQSLHNNISATYTMGEILDYSKTELLNTTLPIQDRFYSAEICHYLGDPSMMIYTEAPKAFANPTIRVKNDSVFVTVHDGEARISFHTPNYYYKASYIGNSASYKLHGKDAVICIDRHNYRPYITKVLHDNYIQDETIGDSRIYTGSAVLKVGNHVTTTKPVGNVVIDGAYIKIKGRNVEIHPGTAVINSKVSINPQD